MDFNANFNQFVEGLSTFLIGVSIVFATLVLLILIIRIISKIVASIENAGAKSQAKMEPKLTSTVPVVPVAEKRSDDLELVAVITAVIAASMGTTSDKLQVRSLRKVERKTR
ncbi:OadG family transporter subunit [Cellulosilyticum sp. I15G10I2]|uniref:OadG family transporter subunit n=1 Tax=Cellulosilyticum sp. I15G10I2 TaxID=1892843 RepID=UPI00085C279A|nr:OadG family protein [Cellulosilyticum sp. I15G10I2]